MQDAAYDSREFAAHHRIHQEFIEEISNVAKKYFMEEKSISFEVINFLKHWLRDHILVTDQKYAAALRNKGFATQSWEFSASTFMSDKQQASTQTTKRWWNLW
ncbi:MAG: hypothetical protein Q8S46_01035 [Methylotenera sp.]|nr:hypothetical protein [Methylotenera sp.]MDO9233349.1 hypothetical protein [Methylotenera sp.]MDO9389781.1 hypothetical protein [Methylotenera sp.]MDP1595892.1 hypothetical protein [Methylotenera sp.]MDP1755119.1 hypothetical protein [Methylotenera sp.]